MKRDDVRGIEYDWLATDDDGHVACFASAGFGDIPNQLFAGAHSDDFLDIDHLAGQLAKLGDARNEGRGPGTCDTYRQLAQGGIYVYDWLDHAGPYERIVVPAIPIRQDLVPRTFMSRAVRLPGICFAETGSFDSTQITGTTG